MMVNAYVRGVPVTVYGYEREVNGFLYAKCKFEYYDNILPVLAELIELRCEND